MRRRLAGVYALLALLTAASWAALFAASHAYPVMLALGVTAFVLGLRHAVDPDHIAAIDNTTRKLLHDGQRPVAVGFFFSLGHSTIVFVLSAVIAVCGSAAKAHVWALHNAGALVGSSVSAAFLLVIAVANVAVLIQTLRAYRNGEEAGPLQGGLLSRVFGHALRLVKHSRDMYPVGLLFGLGFDTATEIAILGISGASAAGGMPVAYILILPALFAAGMSLVDTTEGVAMLGAYGWAYLNGRRRLYYNVNVTLLSATIAVLIAAAQAFVAAGVPVTGIASLSNVGFGLAGVVGVNLAVSAALLTVSAPTRSAKIGKRFQAPQ